LDSYDFLARTYDPILARFTTMDPLCEKYYSISPYAYCGNNPVRYIDPTGMSYGDYYDYYTGEHLFNDGIDDDKVYTRRTQTHFTSGGMFGGSVDVTTTKDEYLGKKINIPDKTIEFTAQLEKTNEFFSKMKGEYSGIFKSKNKILFFIGQVGTGKDYDLKNIEGGTFNEKTAKWGYDHAFFDGKLLKSDDFGNFNFGIAAKAFGISESFGLFGAGAVQIFRKYIKGDNIPVGGALSYGDDYKDHSMIKQGYKYYNTYLKK